MPPMRTYVPTVQTEMKKDRNGRNLFFFFRIFHCTEFIKILTVFIIKIAFSEEDVI